MRINFKIHYINKHYYLILHGLNAHGWVENWNFGKGKGHLIQISYIKNYKYNKISMDYSRLYFICG